MNDSIGSFNARSIPAKHIPAGQEDLGVVWVGTAFHRSFDVCRDGFIEISAEGAAGRVNSIVRLVRCQSNGRLCKDQIGLQWDDWLALRGSSAKSEMSVNIRDAPG